MKASVLRCLKLALVVLGTACAGYGLWQFLDQPTSIPLPRWGGAARIVAVPPELEYRNQQGETTATLEVVLRNDGQAEGKLLDVSASCGCTLPQSLPSSVLPPGKEIQLTINVQPPPYGSRDSVMTIRTDSAETPTIRVPIKLLGRKLSAPYLSLAPSEIRVESISSELPSPRPFQVSTVESPGELWLTGFQSNSEEVSPKTPKLVKEQALEDDTVLRDYEIELEFLSEKGGASRRSCMLTPITRTEPTKPFPFITVNWERVEAIRAAPSSVVLTFRADDADAEQSRRVFLVAADDSDWEITSLEAEQSWLKVEPVARDSTAKHRQIVVTAKRPPGLENSPQQAVVRIGTSHEKCAEVLVRVLATDANRTRSAASR